MWIQVRQSDNQVIRMGDIKLSSRDGTIDYSVNLSDYPDTGPHETVQYDGSSFTVVHDTAAHKMQLEPELIRLYRKWQDAKAIGLSCEAHCKAEYDAQKAIYDAL